MTFDSPSIVGIMDLCELISRRTISISSTDVRSSLDSRTRPEP